VIGTAGNAVDSVNSEVRDDKALKASTPQFCVLLAFGLDILNWKDNIVYLNTSVIA
jgi:hypothetical protein